MLSTIEKRQDQLNQLFEEIFPDEMKRSREGQRQRPARPCRPEMPDDTLVQKAQSRQKEWPGVQSPMEWVHNGLWW